MTITEKDETVKDQILAAAMLVFKKWGLHKTTMEDIAKAAEKGKSTLYYYYKSKEDIFDEAARHEMDQIFKHCSEVIKNVNSAKEKLQLYVTTIFTEIKKRTEFYSIVAQETREDRKIVTNLVSYYHKIEEQIIRDIVKLGVSTKEFAFANRNDQSRAVFIIALILRNLQIEFGINRVADDLIPYTNMISQILINGIRT
jgi:AcrR family transcriptional regulator